MYFYNKVQAHKRSSLYLSLGYKNGHLLCVILIAWKDTDNCCLCDYRLLLNYDINLLDTFCLYANFLNVLQVTKV